MPSLPAACIPRLAGRYARRFRRSDPETTRRFLVEGSWLQGIKNAGRLEIASGVGSLHQPLLDLGAASACGVELAAA